MQLRKLNFLLLLIVSTQLHAQGFLRADGKRIVNNQGNVLLRGIGLGGWMLQEPYMLQMNGIAGTQHEIKEKIEKLVGDEKTDAFYTTWLANHCTKTDIDSLAAWGFNSVRLPMHYNLFTLPIEQEQAGKNTWLPKGFTMVDSLLSWCKSNRIYLILDLHAAPGGQGHDNAISDRDTSKPSLWEAEANREKTIALWSELAKRYAGEEWIGGYDLINETNWGFSDANDKNGCAEKQNEPLKNLLKDITVAIRKVDNNHLIFVEGNCWGNNYNGIFPLWDSNTAVSFHKYWNYNDVASIDKFLKIREEQNVPVWCGESGENSNVWFTSAISLFEAHNIGWAWWPLKKLGFNNPMQISQNEHYRRLLNYWRGKENAPSIDDAYMGLITLAKDTKAENTKINHDVVDAMIRQVQTKQTKPYTRYVLKDTLTVFAVNYDLGRNGEAYFDNDTADYHVATGKNTPGNKGRIYRNDGVDIETTTDVKSNGFKVSSMQAGEWMQYTINTLTGGVFAVSARVSSSDANAQLSISTNGNTLDKAVSIANTSNNWKTVSLGVVSLEKGISTIRVNATAGEVSLNYLELSNSIKR